MDTIKSIGVEATDVVDISHSYEIENFFSGNKIS